MRITKVVLENIRSYKYESIEFPGGSTLLSGDIGSGKSTILLSIEFSLFGFRRTDLNGLTLLRHGEKEGSVELHFTLDGREIIIKRFLKRQATIKQEGYIIINGVKQDMTPVELKSKVLDLLGYPEDLLTKSKESIYRYTVYTPQEEMKHIIFADTQERLDILRRVFGIDKYKRIKENMVVYQRELRKNISYYEGQSYDLDSLIKEEKELSTHHEKIDLDSKEIFQKEELLKKELNEVIVKLTENREKEKEKNTISTKILVNNQKLSNIKEIIARNLDKISLLSKKIEEENKLIESIDTKQFEIFLKEIVDKIAVFEEKKLQADKNLAILKSKNEESLLLTNKINSLDNCPTCKQGVLDNHKHSIENDAKKLIEENNEKIAKILELLGKIKSNTEILLKKKEEINSKLMLARTNEIRKKNMLYDQEQMIKSNEEIEASKLNLLSIEEEILILNKQLNEIKIDDKINDVYNKINLDYQDILKISSTARQKLKAYDEQKESILKRIAVKQKTKEKMDKLNSLHSIFDSFALPLVGVMEKQVMGTIHHEFSSVITRIFSMLIEEDILSLRLDSEFNPIIEQNGYTTSVDNLSGGEKTAVALSYRLALNKVINDVISTIKTKDFLILDEPTDGFSTEQLDKLKDVLNEIKAQIIIVSHDPKMEGFVENNLSVHKTDHESKIF